MSERRSLGARGGAGLVAVIAALVTTAGALGCDETPAHVDAYLDARSARVDTFCSCLWSYIGVKDTETCVEQLQLTVQADACIHQVFETPDTHPDPTLQCYADAERELERCMAALDCDDSDGLGACQVTYNEAWRDCPQLTVDDNFAFLNCHHT